LTSKKKSTQKINLVFLLLLKHYVSKILRKTRFGGQFKYEIFAAFALQHFPFLKNGVVYFSTYGNPLYSTSDLHQIRYTTHQIDLLARGFTSAIWTSRGARPLSQSITTALNPEIVLT